MHDYPILRDMTSDDLVQMLSWYIRESDMVIEADRDFIHAIRDELKKRKNVKEIK